MPLPTDGVAGADQLQQLAQEAEAVAPRAQPTQTPQATLTPAVIRLGDAELPVVPQRVAYLEHRIADLAPQFQSFGDVDGVEGFVRMLGERAYTVLATLIPALPSRMPEHIFRGYPTKQAYQAGEYDEATDSSPTFPEIVYAFEVAYRINRLDLVGNLKSLLDPQLIQRYLRLEMAKAMEASMASRNSASESGDSAPPSSSAESPTMTSPPESPSPSSTG